MITFAPSILSADFNILGQQIALTKEGGAKWAHIDVMDGMFVPSLSVGMPVIKSIRKESDLFFDVHMMVTDPIRYIKDIAESGADLITIHLEAAPDVQAALDLIHSLGKKAGLSVNPGTPVSAAEPYLDSIDLLLVMCVEPGFGGQAYIPSSTEKIAEARRMLAGLDRHVYLQVDGGVKLSNADVVVNAGADVIVAGSAVYAGDVKKNTEDFMALFATLKA